MQLQALISILDTLCVLLATSHLYSGYSQILYVLLASSHLCPGYSQILCILLAISHLYPGYPQMLYVLLASDLFHLYIANDPFEF